MSHEAHLPTTAAINLTQRCAGKLNGGGAEQ
jgi:hypothetical protein